VRILVVLCLAVANSVAVAGDDTRLWLGDMSSALQTLNYDGTFVYLHDDKLEAMRIIHRFDGHGEHERLVSLTGSPREVIRNHETVTCIMADKKSVMVGQSRSGQPFPIVPRDLDSLTKYYQLEDAGDGRVADSMARIIVIMPRDTYRYGYRFWIDKTSKMPLKSDMTGADGDAIEQVMFTRLETEQDIPEDALRPSLTGDDYTWYMQEAGSDPARDSAAGETHWAVKDLPAGFVLTHAQSKRISPDGEGVEHLVFSDGLATVSVYVEKAVSDEVVFTGLSTMGALNTFEALAGGHKVTVVGEVPAATVQMMARSIYRNE